jgi:4-hydroxybenzoate polyprenyltransferase
MIRGVLTEIRIEHTLFALPFAYVGAIFAAHGLPNVVQLIWITLAVLGARTAAMAANRYIDRDIDARNPRTKKRGSANGTIPPYILLWTIVIGLALLIAAAFALNPLCAVLLPFAILGIVIYPFCKRLTWGTHFVLGAVDGFAPLGAFIAIANGITLPALLLFLAVTLWVAGFDIIYALMDYKTDVEQHIYSIPSRFGISVGYTLPIVLHTITALLLWVIAPLTHPHPTYYLGIVLAWVLVCYEQRLCATLKDVFTLNERVFQANMLFSMAFLATTIMGFMLR